MPGWRAGSIIGKRQPIDALAAASAANGDFDAAVRYEEQAIKSEKLSSEELEGAQARLARYSQHQPPRRATR